MRLHSALVCSVLFLAACETTSHPTEIRVPPPSFDQLPPNGYEFVFLGTPADNFTEGTGINASGNVVGLWRDAALLPHPAYWSLSTGVVDLTPSGTTEAYSYAINDQGQVPITARMVDGTWSLYMWTPTGGHQLLADLGTDGGNTPTASGINESGDIVGRTADGTPFRWTSSNGLEPLSSFVTDVPASLLSSAVDINDAGQITFRAESQTPEAVLDGFIWTPGVGSTQIASGAYASLPHELNNAGQVAVTRWDLTPDLVISSYRWSSLVVDPVGSIDPSRTDLRTINQWGQMAGWSGSTPVLWDEDNGLVVLPTPAGRGFATGINDDGLIVGTIPGHATLWRPAALPVVLDVKPGSDVNPVNLKSRGTLPVAVLSTDEFGADDIDVATLLLGDGNGSGTPVGLKHSGRPHASMEDVDGDGRPDLVLHFELPAMVANGDVGPGSTSLCLRGATGAGDPIRGCDVISVR